MFSLIRKPGKSNRSGSHLALAIALATGSAMTLGAIAEPAQAQRNKKKKDEAPKADYSKGFIKAFSPIQEAVNGESPDYAALAGQIPALLGAVETDDDRLVAGQTVYNVGVQTDNDALQLQGLDLMIASGKGDANSIGQRNFAAYQLRRGSGDIAATRADLEGAIAAGYTFSGQLADGTTKQFGPEDMQLMIAELYVDNNDLNGGLDYLGELIQERTTAGQTPPSAWIRRGLSIAYNNQLNAQADNFSLMLLKHYPSDAIWGDTIAIQRNLKPLEGDELLDLLRLSRRVNALREVRDFEDYVQAADARKLPGEVDAVITLGTSSGVITGGNMFISDARDVATDRIRADRAELPALERDAMAASANLRTVTAAGDVFLSYDDYAKAETFYTKALGMSGVDTPEVQTRLGIAQIEQGKYDEARATLAQVQGPRKATAMFWSAYADQKEGAVTISAPMDTTVDAVAAADSM